MGNGTVSFVVSNKSIARGVGEDDKAGTTPVSADRNVKIDYTKSYPNKTLGDSYCSVSNGRSDSHTYYSSGWSGSESSFGLYAPQYKVFLSLIGDDKILSLSDLKNAKKIAKDFNVKVDDSKLQSEGKVIFTFKNGHQLSVDFETDAERRAKAGDNTMKAVTDYMNSEKVRKHVLESANK